MLRLIIYIIILLVVISITGLSPTVIGIILFCLALEYTPLGDVLKK